MDKLRKNKKNLHDAYKENLLKEGTLIAIFCVLPSKKERDFYIPINLYSYIHILNVYTLNLY